MNEDEKKKAIDILAAHIRETRPYLFQLSARHDEELGLIAALAEAIEDALLSSVKALPFPADDIFRGSGDGTREYTATFVL